MGSTIPHSSVRDKPRTLHVLGCYRFRSFGSEKQVRLANMDRENAAADRAAARSRLEQEKAEAENEERRARCEGSSAVLSGLESMERGGIESESDDDEEERKSPATDTASGHVTSRINAESRKAHSIEEGIMPGAQAVAGINSTARVATVEANAEMASTSGVTRGEVTTPVATSVESRPNLIAAELVDDKEEDQELRQFREMPTAKAEALSSQEDCIDAAFMKMCCCFPESNKASRSIKIFCVVAIPLIIVIGAVVGVIVGTSSSSSASETVAPTPKEDQTALLMIDIQDCFMDDPSVTGTGEPGTLAVNDAAKLIPILNVIRSQRGCLFDHIVRSQDFHPHLHISFGPTYGLPPFAHLVGKGGLPVACTSSKTGSCCPSYFVEDGPHDCDNTLCPVTENMTQEALDHVLTSPACNICKDNPGDCFTDRQPMWPDHCLQDGDTVFPAQLDVEDTDIVFQKGDNDFVDGYSPFMDNTRRIRTELDSILKERNVKTVYIAGIATDFGVFFTASHSIFLGYKTYVILDATVGIAQDTTDAAIAAMEAEGAIIINTSDLLAMKCSFTE